MGGGQANDEAPILPIAEGAEGVKTKKEAPYKPTPYMTPCVRMRVSTVLANEPATRPEIMMTYI